MVTSMVECNQDNQPRSGLKEQMVKHDWIKSHFNTSGVVRWCAIQTTGVTVAIGF